MLPIETTYEPMEAQLADKLPPGDGWLFEPKWDGFRCLAHRDGGSVILQSKSNKELTRYFPEVCSNLLELQSEHFVLDGEIVLPVPGPEGFSFDLLLQRIHPAASRVKKLAQTTPCVFIVFDILADGETQLLTESPLSERREHLEQFMEKFAKGNRNILLSPATTDATVTEVWQKDMGTKLDGIIAKRIDLPYQTGTRKGMVKVKNMRTADCVIGGFRYASGNSKALGSILLGLYDNEGKLNHVGFSSAFNAKEKIELLSKLEPLIAPPGFTGDAPGGPSRWSTERSAEWQPLEPSLVVEIKYDHFTNGRFRHGTSVLRWRPDKSPEKCTYDQLG